MRLGCFFSPTSELDMKHPTNPFCVTLAKFPVPTGSLDQVSFNVAKSPFKTFFAVARIPSPVIDIRSHYHNITAGWSQKRGPFCSENRVILMQIVSTRSGCPVPRLHSGASQILWNSRFSASELRKISWPSTVFWLRQEAPWWRPANLSRRRRMHWDLGQNAGILGGWQHNGLKVLLMEEILQHLGCLKLCK